MFAVTLFHSVNPAVEHIKKILAEIETPRSLEFQVIHSISEFECTEDGGTWEDVSNILGSFLRDLDSQQGYMVYDTTDYPMWDYLVWDKPDETVQTIYKPVDQSEIFVQAGEGLAVIHNPFALCEEEYPVVVVKKTLWDMCGDTVRDILKIHEPGNDYTSKISPAVYLELFYAHEEVVY